jgi:SAM-dependent methyltransferase
MEGLAMDDVARGFAGSVPQLYERYMVPLMFDVYAADLAATVARLRPSRVLEIAAGTGVLTRRLARDLPDGTVIVATDLSEPMLDYAAELGTARPVEWRRADATNLPFPDDDFDLVVCQFGAMFFPDKAQAYAEVRRVLRPGGQFLFNVWDRIQDNDFTFVVDQALKSFFPDDPPRFMASIPHGYHDAVQVSADLVEGGFDRAPDVATLTARSRAESPRIPAIALCQGTPLRREIEARDPSRLMAATDHAAGAIAARFGSGPVDGKLQAHVFVVER